MVLEASDFIHPPTDGSIAAGEVIDFHLEKNPSYPFAILYDTTTHLETTITYEQLAYAIHHAAHFLSSGGTIPQGTTVGILISTDTLTYIILVLGAMRAGLVPFPVSHRTPVEGIANLCTKSKTSHVLVGGSVAISQLANNLKSSLPHLNLIEIPSVAEVFPNVSQLASNSVQHFKRFPKLSDTGDESVIAILHSSGSTGIPRPIPLHQGGIFKNVINQTTLSMYSKPGTRVGTMALPTFHVLGLLTQYLTPLFIGYVQVLFAPKSTYAHMPVVPTAQLTIKAVSDTHCDYLISVPAFLETWSQDKTAISELRKLTCITFSGATLAEHTGNMLADQGVRLHSGYGATELGYVVAPYDPLKQGPRDWAYIRLSERVEALFEPQHDTEDSHELVFMASGIYEPFVINSMVGSKRGYRTKDLVVKHPTKPDLWKIVGRLDDQIVLLNGEKTNPIPMEAEILRSPIVQYAAMFGRERNQTGVLLELTEDVKEKQQSHDDRADLVDQIWPYIEKANQVSFTHSRITRNAIIFTSPTQLLPRTPKGTVSRSAALSAYATEIEEMYATLDGSTNSDLKVELPRLWTDGLEVQGWVGKRAKEVLGKDIESDADLFQQGMDSLTAAILLRTIRTALCSSQDPMVLEVAQKLGHQTIFSHPTVEQLANLLVELCAGSHTSVSNSLNSIRATIQTYDSFSTEHKALLKTRKEVEKERVLVTGTTGGLGSHLLAVLLESDQVERVWAVNRKSAGGVVKRQKAAFEDKMLDPRLLSSPKLVMLEANLGDEILGLEKRTYQEIQYGVTSIIHCAWQVNFNLSLQSFHPDIRGTRNLLDMALSSPIRPRFLFASSVSAAGFGKSEHLEEEYLKLEDLLGGIGYGQSKLVAEKLLESARESGLETCVIRLGQLTGDKRSGAWSTTDWVPAMISSSVSVGCFPAAIGNVSWTPLDIAAHTIVEACLAPETLLPCVIHIAHPRPVKWSHLIYSIAEVLKSRTYVGGPLKLVPLREWNERIINAASKFEGPESERYKRYPSTKIQNIFDGITRVDIALRDSETRENIDAGVR